MAARVFLLAILLATTVFGAEQKTVLGIWKTEEDKSKVEIFNCVDKLCGKIVWLKEPNFTNSKDGPVGKPKMDTKNPRPELRNRPVLGLQIMEGFKPSGDNKWENGTVYDPQSGKTYHGKMRLVSPDRLELRGYVGISLFGRTAVWTR